MGFKNLHSCITSQRRANQIFSVADLAKLYSNLGSIDLVSEKSNLHMFLNLLRVLS